jgi:hypothetical protein
MRTLPNINRKHNALSRRFKAERALRCYENGGNTYIEQFEEFVGDTREYCENEKWVIRRLWQSLFNLVTH